MCIFMSISSFGSVTNITITTTRKVRQAQPEPTLGVECPSSHLLLSSLTFSSLSSTRAAPSARPSGQESFPYFAACSARLG